MLSKEKLLAEIKRLESENADLKRNCSENLESIKVLIMKISHEMKTPLNSIIGFSELFKYRNLDEKLSVYADNILTSSKYMLSLIQNMIDITKFRNNQLKLSYSIFNTKDAIEEVLSGFNNSKINYTIIDKTISADYIRFKQMIYNLVSNSVKYNQNNKNILINIITYTDNNYFFFEISDNGVGIKEDDYNRIFELYSQVTSDYNKSDTGLGIGLALCKTIAEVHGGKIWVESVYGQGATFIFKLPLRQIQNL